MAKTGRSLTELAAEIQKRSDAKKDFLAPVEQLTMVGSEENVQLAAVNGKEHRWEISDLAHEQVAAYTGIPLAYYRKMREEAPHLLAENVNRWLADHPEDRRMIRTMYGKARAFLSDRYRPLENEDLAEAVLPILNKLGVVIVSSEITERRLYIKAVDKSILKDVPTGKRIGDGSHTFFDTISPAIILSNSEVGAGSLSVESGVWTAMCTNLAAMGAAMRKYHAGARADFSEEVAELLTDKTKKLTDAAVWSQVQDIVAGAFDRARFEAQAMKLGEAAEQKLPGKEVVEVIERVGRKFTLTEGERNGVLEHLINGGDLTRYGLHAAVTRYSADVEEYDRATELERLGGEIINLAQGEWKTLVAA